MVLVPRIQEANMPNNFFGNNATPSSSSLSGDKNAMINNNSQTNSQNDARYNLNRRPIVATEVKVEQAIQVLQTGLPTVIDKRTFLNLGDDFAEAADGKKSMKFYDPTHHAMTADAPMVILSSFASAYKREGVAELDAEIMAGNKLVLENVGHAARLVENCIIGNASDEDIARWTLLQGHQHVFFFGNAEGTTLSYVVVDGPDFIEYSVVGNKHRDLEGKLYIKSQTMSEHKIDLSEAKRLAEFNTWLVSQHYSPISEAPMNKFQMAIFMKTGFSLVANVGFGKIVDDLSPDGRYLNTAEFQKALIAGNGEAKSKLSHIIRGYQGQLGQELGLRAEHFAAAREYLKNNG